jgi:hypothetical protein
MLNGFTSATAENQKIIVQEISFELQSCKLSSGVVTCQLMITNEASEDKDFTLGGDSQIVDDSGNIYHYAESQISGGKKPYAGRRRTSGSKLSQAVLIHGIGVKATLKFENISSEVKTLKLLRVSFSAAGSFNADFRDFLLTK